MNNHNTCPECGAPNPGQQEGELCDMCADKQFRKSNNWHDNNIGKANGSN